MAEPYLVAGLLAVVLPAAAGAAALPRPVGQATAERPVRPAAVVPLDLEPAAAEPRPRGGLPPEIEDAIVRRARAEVENVVRYDASYRLLSGYPNGDIPADRGACTDLVIRALRSAGVDLQVRVHEDFLAAPRAYATGEKGNAHVEHRRVPTLQTWFARNTDALPTDWRQTETFRPGDVVFFSWKRCYPGWPCIASHVAIVSDRRGRRGLPLVLQNGGPVATESDGLDHGTIAGHYRLRK